MSSDPTYLPLTPDDPAGTTVVVTLDNGAPWYTTTRSRPWQLGDGTWVVLLAGRTGGYRLDRCEVCP